MTGPAADRRALMRTYAEPPVTFVRGAGTVLYDADGAEYLDFITGLAVINNATGVTDAAPVTEATV